MHLPPPDLLIVILATWRISNVIASEHGPARFFSRIREGKYHEFLSCIYCVSVWVALICYGIALTEAFPVLYPFAISGAALMLRSYTGAGMNG